MPGIKELGEIEGVLLASFDIHGDERGIFVETYRKSWFPNASEMIQGNRADRQKGCIVGLHYHLHQSDYWYVPKGTARVVLYDLRQSSPTNRKAVTLELGDDNQQGVFIPPGVGHGFAALTDMTITYMVDHYYDNSDELGVAWNDPEMALDWGVSDPVLSGRDLESPFLADIPKEKLPA